MAALENPMILLVEDNPADVRLTREVLRETGMVHELQVAVDGQQALDMLFKRDTYANNRVPDLILLDLNLPKRNGREVLAEIKQDPHLRRVPVLVLTTSKSDDDVTACYNLHANCFMTKPLEFDDFYRFAHSIKDFWLGMVQLPPKLAH